MPSRYQEGLKETKELQELKEEEEERKSESPEETEEAEDIEDEGKDQRSRLEPLPLLNRSQFISHTTSLQMPVQGLSESRAQMSNLQKPGGHSCWGRRQRKSQRAKRVNKGMFARAERSEVVGRGVGL